MSIYIRDFEDGSIKMKDSVKISSFIPKGMLDVIRNNIPDKNFILGVSYDTGDSQICISGHPKEYETFEQGMLRELKEELCLEPRVMMLPVLTLGQNTFYCLNVRDATIRRNKKLNKNKDIDRRAVICVHGSEKDILLYLAKVQQNILNDDHIKSIWATSKENIINYSNSEKKDTLFQMRRFLT